MTAISPNRTPMPDDIHSRGRLHVRTGVVQVSAVVAVLAGMVTHSWSESAPADLRAEGANTGVDQIAANQPATQRSAIKFVARTEKPAVARTEYVSSPTPADSKPSFAPPLSIADYENYIKSRWNSFLAQTQLKPVPSPAQAAAQVPASATSKQLEPIASVEQAHDRNEPSVDQPPRDVAFAERPAAPAVAPRVHRIILPASPGATVSSPSRDYRQHDANIVVRPKAEDTTPIKSPTISEYPSTNRSLVVSKPVDNSSNEVVDSPAPRQIPVENYLAPSPADEPDVAIVAQAPEAPKHQPAPVEPPAVAKAESAPPHPESMPMQAADNPPAPMTNSSYLPANPEEYCFRCGVKCPPCGCNPGGPGWSATRPIPWEVFAQGEYVGPARLAHVPVYRLRVDDQLAFVYRLSGAVSGQPYRLNVRDRIQVQSLSAPEVVNREVLVEPDGTITLPLLGQVRAAGATLEELSKNLDEQYKRQIKDPRITVTPLEMNSNLQELRSSVDRRYGAGGQVSDARISPDGTVQLPAIGSVPAQGLTLEELEREVKARYAQLVEGLEVTPILTARAPRFVYVVGEVRVPGRYTMEGPTTLMQAIALAGSWNVGAQLNEVVVFRRDENWRLMATKVNIRSSLLFKKPCPSGEIWLRDSDIVLIPKSPILCADDVIDLVFTRGIYGVFPMSATLNFAKLTSI